MTIGVDVADGKIVQRPYSVASLAGVAGADGYEILRPPRRGRPVHAAAVAAAGRATGCG